MTKVKLTDLVDALDLQFDESHACINKETGGIYTIQDEAIRIIEDESTDYPDWMNIEISQAKEYLVNPDNFIDLPDNYDLDEYRMMETFASNQNDKHTQEKLLIALDGRGAFGRFKNTVNFLDIAEEWYSFRDEQYKAFARRWCKMKNIELVE